MHSAGGVVAVETDAPAVIAPVGPRLDTGLLPAPRRTDQIADRIADRPFERERMQDSRPGFRRNLALIGVGLAAIVIGSEVDDAPGTILVLGGAGLSLYGFYNILR